MDYAERQCATCGLEESAWKGGGGEGACIEGEWYCCQACAEETGCTCIDKDIDQPLTDRDLVEWTKNEEEGDGPEPGHRRRINF